MTENNNNLSITTGKILYLSMEMLFPEMGEDCRQANFKGGLGILAGDTMEGFNDIGINVTAITPIYKNRWVQSIQDSRQIVETVPVSYDNEPMEPILKDGAPLVLPVDFEDNTYEIQIFKIIRGGVTVYLLYNEEVYDILYVNDRKFRLRQEVIIGRVVPLLIKELDLEIDCIHFNEAHTILAACHMKDNPKFEATPIIFTTHTPVPAGMEKYPDEWFPSFGIKEKYREIFKRTPDSYDLDLTLAAIRLSTITNGVSVEHADVTKNMFMEYRHKITSVTNGSSVKNWQMPELKAAENITPEYLWDLHVKYKKLALVDASWRLKETMGVDIEFDINKPTVGMYRRIVDYKNQYPMLRDIIGAVCAPRGDRVKTVFGELDGLGMQVFVAGFAHPTDAERQEWVREFINWTVNEPLKGSFAFLPGYGEVLLKHGARACEVWISCPYKNMEACGTSDQRAALNGNLNIATYSGGPKEYLKELDPRYLTGSGLFIDPYDPRTLYRKLETVSNLIYETIYEENDTYKKLMLNAYNAGLTVAIDRMAEQYVSNCYVPALEMIKWLQKAVQTR
ncbi:MAG: glycogen/starch synthase [Elusimicrobia bacterium]|nr:glycogen/starch synthase [Elusimicrobiota bacterium]